MAFTREARNELLNRDGWTCQNDECIGYYMGVGALRWEDGWNVNGAHFPDKHKRGDDNDPRNGRCLCVFCHCAEEMNRHNFWGSNRLQETQPVRNSQWIKEHGYQSPVLPPEFVVDWKYATTDQEREGLARAFAEIMQVPNAVFNMNTRNQYE